MDYAPVVLGAVFWESSDGRDAGEPRWEQGDQGIVLNERFVTSIYWGEDSVCGWCIHAKLQLRLPSLLGVTGSMCHLGIPKFYLEISTFMWSMTDYIVISSDLRWYILDTQVKRAAELSTDQHRVVVLF